MNLIRPLQKLETNLVADGTTLVARYPGPPVLAFFMGALARDSIYPEMTKHAHCMQEASQPYRAVVDTAYGVPVDPERAERVCKQVGQKCARPERSTENAGVWVICHEVTSNASTGR